MVNKKIIISLLILVILPMLSVDAKAECNINSNLIYQDPHPALPGDYVEVLFQISGVSSGCEDGASIDLIYDYPFSLDGKSSKKNLNANTYVGYNYGSNWNVVYNLRIDENAIKGDYELELRYKEGANASWNNYGFDNFNITIEDGRTDFEIHIQDHNILERNIVFEVLNIGDQDIEALTLEIPKQENIEIKGSNRNIVGDLDSNEYTTADFEAIPADGEILVRLYYTDSTNERRMITKTVVYDSTYFLGALENVAEDKTLTYFIIAAVMLGIGLIFLRKRKLKNHKKRKKFEI
ncbi:hypothetical protein HON86_02485 [Candidatus Woesearchaeota archaeon]|jgi:hypothetical protein|nr:hypothetical protein [Candidatus Woesearchaeota archaeon]MBT4835464.1 hypothetical protein [Candidatus Woesearchaeota archaeon]MBT6734844.1 hypothetical protein [Candidatus Woesearchaeota archaeon]MBT7169641.1 hypothetical protein [Candidatus Woesearchaeota archaeon]MBT7474599.1 hypothetical protein [Candidatus Woesearchaeota archaeon]